MTATATDLETIVYSGDYRVDSLLGFPAVWNFWPDSRNVLYYTFDASTGSIMDGETTELVTAFNSTQQQATRQILQHASLLTGIVFNEVGSSTLADVHFAATNLPGASIAGLTSSYYRYRCDWNNALTELDAETLVYLDNVEHANINQQPVAGSIGYEVLLHEIGHMLGLGHPFGTPYALPAAEDHTDNTVMSYTWRGSYKSEFQAYDVITLDWLYGRDGLGGTWGQNSTHGSTLNLPNSTVNHSGTLQNDRLVSSSANEAFDGLEGTDTVVLDGLRADYTLTRQSTGWTLQDTVAGRDGSDTLQRIERLQFANQSLALDLDGAAGTTARLMGAMLGASGLDHADWVGAVLHAVDSGLSGTPLYLLALQAVLGPAPSHAQIVTHLYYQLYHSTPSTSTLQALSAALDAQQYTPAELVAWAAASDANAANIGLAGLSAQGLEFVPV